MFRSSFVFPIAAVLLLTSALAAQTTIAPPGAGAPPQSAHQLGPKSDPGDYYFYSGENGDTRVPLTPSTEMLSVRFNAGVGNDDAIRSLLATPGISGGAAFTKFTERNSAYVALEPGLSADQTRAVARRLANDPNVIYSELVYFHETERFGGTNRFIIKFSDLLTIREVRAVLGMFDLTIVKALGSGRNTFVIEVGKGADWNATEFSNIFIEQFRDITDYSNPDYVLDRVTTFTPNDTLYTSQWHLNSTGQNGAKVNADVDAPEAWDITKGLNTTIIAVIDTGMDLAHEDLSYVTGWNAISNNNNPAASGSENHATAVAGVCAGQGNNGKGVSGSCPNCKVMPIRLIVSGMTTADEAESFNFAWQNGAAIINNSWGPVGSVATLPSSTKAAIDAATTSGRGGKGCVVLFAAGNDNVNSDSNGYSAYSRVISVAASTDQDLKAYYSNTGSTVDVCAPSNGGVTSGITTCDRTGSSGYSTGNYTSTFGGTSSATPLTSGIVGLILAVDPNLTYDQVRTNLINNTIKIDQAGGGYVNGFSTKYGYGKVNAKNSVVAAGGTTPPPTGTNITVNSTNVPLSIPDNNATGIQSTLGISAAGTINSVSCSVNITHTYIGDLNVSLIHPDGTTSVLHANAGGSADNIVQTYAPTAFNGKNLNGTWKLKIVDSAAQDVGTLNSWSLTINYNPAVSQQTFTFTSINVPVGIPDNNATGSSSVLAAGAVTGTVVDVNVTVNITHTYIGDLTVSLVHPDGTTVILHNKTGGSADNIVTSYDTLTVPAQSLSAFNSKSPTGTWTLKMTDTAAADVGTLNSWSIQVVTQ